MTVTDTRTFGPYEIVRRLGVGGMAETFLALRRGAHGVEQRVCLKRVLPAFASDPSFLRQFEREAKIASTLRYTGIVAVVEFGDVDGAKYLALELVDGVDLRDFLLSRPGHVLDPTTVGRVALDLAYALRYAHDPARGVVHRDLSPANVMLSRTGEVKLTDFGVARVMSSAAPTTSTGVRGKVAYMSPEHLRGEELDGRADLFALGVLLYECLCGRRPFQGAHDVAIMRRIAAGERAPVVERAPVDTPPLLLRAIEGLLTTDREARTPSATALIEQLSPLPGLHQARRRLGAQVDALRGGANTREHVSDEREEASDTSLSPVPADALRELSRLLNTPSVAGVRGVSENSEPSRDGDTTWTTVVAAPTPAPRRAVAPRPAPRARAQRAVLLLLAGVLLVGAVATYVGLPGALSGVRPTAPSERAAAPPRVAGGQAPAAERRRAPVSLGASDATRSATSVAAGEASSALGGARVTAALEGGVAARPASTPSHPGPPRQQASSMRAVEPADSSEGAHPALAQVAAAASTHAAAGAPERPSDTAAAPRTEVPSSHPDTGQTQRADGPEDSPNPQDDRPGTLRVTVIPWGDVWVDGRYMGRAPTEVTLRPGRHVVAVGADRPSTRRSVTIAPGQARRVELELTP
ncbi:MAG: protein kinase [Polyangiales bacterium]|nr:protein kinase [Myxococcales bacterium]MCB9659483.1 protein kinase [Sandaracinaceae bacterium]